MLLKKEEIKMIKTEFKGLIGPFEVVNKNQWEREYQDMTYVAHDWSTWRNGNRSIVSDPVGESWSYHKTGSDYKYCREVDYFEGKKEIQRLPLVGKNKQYVDCGKIEIFKPKLMTPEIKKLQRNKKIAIMFKFLRNETKTNEIIKRINHEIISLKWIKK